LVSIGHTFSSFLPANSKNFVYFKETSYGVGMSANGIKPEMQMIPPYEAEPGRDKKVAATRLHPWPNPPMIILFVSLSSYMSVSALITPKRVSLAANKDVWSHCAFATVSLLSNRSYPNAAGL